MTSAISSARRGAVFSSYDKTFTGWCSTAYCVALHYSTSATSVSHDRVSARRDGRLSSPLPPSSCGAAPRPLEPPIAFHSIPFHSIPFHSIALHCTTLHYIALHYTTSHHITSHHITSHHIDILHSSFTLHYVALKRYIIQHYIAPHYITLHCVVLHYATLQAATRADIWHGAVTGPANGQLAQVGSKCA